MFCYKDKTFCDYKDCDRFVGCHRALTQDVLDAAERWYGGKDCPICQYSEKPDCFKEKEK